MKCDIGLYGLGVMGVSLARNIADKGYPISVFNIDPVVTTSVCEQYPSLHGYDDIKAFIHSLKTPRRILLMVTAGKVVDDVIASLLPLLEKQDIIIDCGNSYFLDTERRYHALKQKGIRYLGCGVSGGEKGALEGPSIMPGGDASAYEDTKMILEAMAAKNEDGSCCCAYIGDKGAGHFVKMVHNGIEYADMQLIAEVYEILMLYYKEDHDAVCGTLERLAQGRLSSYLMDITIGIVKHKGNDGYLLDQVSDVARQKGTGKWTSQVSFDYGTAIPSLSEAVQARFLSVDRRARAAANDRYPCQTALIKLSEEELYEQLEASMYAARCSIYAQGLSLIADVSRANNDPINMAVLASIWQNGCIIKSAFLKEIMQAYQEKDIPDLLCAATIASSLRQALVKLQGLLSQLLLQPLYLPVFTSALQYLMGYRMKRMPTCLIQAQRDCFGAHTYERIDQEGSFHSDWLSL